MAGYLVPLTSIGRDRLLFCGRGFHALHTVAGFIFELFSLYYDEIPGQRIFLLTAHSSGRSMSYMPNVSMSGSHKTAEVGNFWLQFLFPQWDQHLTGAQSYGYHFRTHHLPPDWFEWPPWNTTFQFKRHNVIISTVPLFNRGRLLHRG